VIIVNAALESKLQSRLRIARRHALGAWLFFGVGLAAGWGLGIGMGPCGPGGPVGCLALAIVMISFLGVVITTFSAFSGIAWVWTHTRMLPDVPMPGLPTLLLSIGVWVVMFLVTWRIAA
jgi:hypothetical protein